MKAFTMSLDEVTFLLLTREHLGSWTKKNPLHLIQYLFSVYHPRVLRVIQLVYPFRLFIKKNEN
jgi:hypothetical protein